MGLFEVFRRNRHPKNSHIYLEIIRCLSDRETTEHFYACTTSPETWYHAHVCDYESRSIPPTAGHDIIIWIGMADYLLTNGIAAELDYAAELTEFLDVLHQLASTQIIDETWFDESDSVPEWCAKLNTEWKNTDTCVGAVDIDSDSYVLFVTSCSTLIQLQILAKSVNRRIDLAHQL